MNSGSRNKKFGLKKVLKSIKYSFEGVVYAYKNEQSMYVHLAITIIAVICGIAFKINAYEWMITIVFLSVAGAFELINTAIEATVDLVTKDIHPLAKAAKDAGSAASFFMSVGGIITFLIIYVPKIMALF